MFPKAMSKIFNYHSLMMIIFLFDISMASLNFVLIAMLNENVYYFNKSVIAMYLRPFFTEIPVFVEKGKYILKFHLYANGPICKIVLHITI